MTLNVNIQVLPKKKEDSVLSLESPVSEFCV